MGAGTTPTKAGQLPLAGQMGLGYASPTTPKPTRLASLDIFRGLTIAGMLLVNNPGPGGPYDPLEHASWNGWTPTDLVFPFFVFIMGVAIPFSMAKRSATESKNELFLHVLARGLALFLLGEFGYGIPRFPTTPAPAGFAALTALRVFAVIFLAAGFFVLLYPWKSKKVSLLVPFVTAVAFVGLLLGIHFFNAHAVAAGRVPADYQFGTGVLNPDALRIPGVLQRLGVVYVFAGGLALLAGGSWTALATAAVVVYGIYSILMLQTPYPSLTVQGKTVHGLLDRYDNFARYVDTTVLGQHVYSSYPDPEGIVSTLPAIGTALLGILAGLWLRTQKTLGDRCAGLMAFGVLACLLGWILNSALMPINKQLWTPSYSVFCAGLALLGLGTFFYLADVLLIRRPFLPLTWYGMNAITAFVLAGILARTLMGIHWAAAETGKPITAWTYLSQHAAHLGQKLPLGDPAHNGSLAWALCIVLFFALVMGLLYRLRIFLKV